MEVSFRREIAIVTLNWKGDDVPYKRTTKKMTIKSFPKEGKLQTLDLKALP